MKEFDPKKYDFKRNLILCGHVGVGKTFQAKKLLEKLPTDNLLAKYEITDAHFKQLVKSNQLILRGPQDYHCRIDTYPLEMMRRVKVLLFDDIGVADKSDAYIRDLTYILDERISRKLVTIFTTNLKKEELYQKLDERIVSRMLYNCDVCGMQGKDRRADTTEYYFLKGEEGQ